VVGERKKKKRGRERNIIVQRESAWGQCKVLGARDLAPPS
jgi:hypothetical protein